MSDPRKVSEIYVDVDTPQLVDVNNSIVHTPIIVYRKSQLIFKVHLRLADGSTYFTPPVGAEWVFMIDNSYEPLHPDLVVSDNAQFNVAGDWASMDVANGKICFRVNTATAQLTTEMGSSASKEMTGEIWMLPIGGDPSLVIQFSILVKNIVGDVGADANLIYTDTNMLKFDGSDVVLYFPDGSVAQRWSRI